MCARARARVCVWGGVLARCHVPLDHTHLPSSPTQPHARTKLHLTGPLFDQSIEAFDFYNLELSDTNVVDHNTHDYASQQGVTYAVQPC